MNQRPPRAQRLIFMLVALSPLMWGGCFDVVTSSPGPNPPSPSDPPNPPTHLPGPPPPQKPPVMYGFEVVSRWPHDAAAFTEGLLYRDGVFFEGTGLQGQSSVRRVTPMTGAVTQRRDLDSQYFGEGIDVFGGRLFQLTWQSNVGFIYDATSFMPVGQFSYTGEGWGLTDDGRLLIMSDGTAALRFLDPMTQQVQKMVTVTDGGKEVTQLNELEYVRGEVYANVWMTDRIARIDPTTGYVTGWVDLAGLLPEADRANADVLNGIAYDAATDRLWVTGKRWPAIFEIKLVAK